MNYKTFKIITIVTAILLITIKTRSQLPSILYYMENIPQSSLINPAMAPRANTFIAVPLVNSYTTYNGNLAVGDFFQVHDGIPYTLWNDKDEFDYSLLYDKINGSMDIELTEHISPAMFGFRLNRNYFTFGFSEKVQTSYEIPQDLLKFGDVGIPAEPNNEHFDFGTFSTQIYYYREFIIGFSREINNKLTVGTHIKPLFGKAGFKTDIQSFTIDASGELYHVNASGKFYASLPIKSITYDNNGFPENIEMQDMELKDYVNKYGTSFSNPGIAFDFGAVYNLDERWSFSAAINDLGFLNFKSDLQSLSFNGEYDYEGPEFTPANYDEGEVVRDDILESLKDSLNFIDGNSNFKMGLSPVLYAGSSFRINHVFTMGFLSRSKFQKNNFKQHFNFSANLNLYNQISATVNYSLNINEQNYLGFGMSCALGPLELYALINNIPTTLRNYKKDGNKYLIPDQLKSGSLLVGLNILFGAKGYRDKPMISMKN